MVLTQLLLASTFLFAPQSATQAAITSPEKIAIPSANGVAISATYRNAGPGSPGVLLFPMCSENALEGWTPVAERLRSAGVSSLLITYPSAMYDEPADADAALAYLRSRVGTTAAVAVAGSSCGVHFALRTVERNPKLIRAAVAFAGPHQKSQLEFIRNTPDIAVLSGSAQLNTPAPDWARELNQSSRHKNSRVLLPSGKAHGTDVFAEQPNVAVEIADWLVTQLK